MFKYIILSVCTFLLLGCKKKNDATCAFKNQECDVSQFTLINRTQDTVFYGIGTNIWLDTLLPGQQQILKYGKVKVTYDKDCVKNRESWSTHTLSSNFGSWAYNIDHCSKRSAFEYDPSGLTVSVVDATEY
jgi:hypothetical protein